MTAATIDQVRAAFEGDEALAARFGRRFIAAYAATAFGVLPKTEIDLLVFGLLVEGGVIDADGPIYRIARALNVTPAKARNLLFQHQLRTVSEEDADHAVMITLTTARYRREGDSLAFGVSSPLIYAAIRARMQEGGVFADVSLSGDILKVSPGQFGAVIASLVTPGQAEALIQRLRGQKLVDQTQLRAGIEKVAGKLASDALSTGGEAAVGETFKVLGDLIVNHGGAAWSLLVEALT